MGKTEERGRNSRAGLAALAALATLATCLLLGPACTSDFSLSQVAEEPCNQCTFSRCRSEMTLCETDALSCAPWLECTTGCRANDQAVSACDEQCLEEGLHQAGYSTNPVSICQADRCAQVCGRPCGGWVNGLERCGQCMGKHCCQPAKACGLEPGCLDIGACLDSCAAGDWNAYNACFTRQSRQESIDRYFENALCAYTSCLAECEIGGFWDCVGEFQTLPERDPSISVKFIIKSVSLEPLAGVKARACYWDDPDDCPQPLGTGETDASGILEMTLEPNPAIQFRIDLTLDGFLPAMLIPPLPFNSYWTTFYPFLLFTQAQLAQMAQRLQIELLADRGHALVFFLDCSMLPAPNLTIASEAVGATVVAFHEYLPNTSDPLTDRTGLALIVNLPPGLTTLKATHASDSTREVLNGDVLIHPKKLSFGYLWPRL